VQPETRYTLLRGDRIAYQILGQGPPDLVMSRASFGHVDIAWEDPGITLFLRTLASFSRLILFDRRGAGASDPLPPDPLPTWESHAEELAVVLDEVGSERAAILAEADASHKSHYNHSTTPAPNSYILLDQATAK
jgi:pimeloyl-ACP methyl ester carboxylesterase